MYVSIFLGFVVCSLVGTGAVKNDKCYAESDFYPFMATKTAYKYVHGSVGKPGPSCKPVQMWMLARHGTRYPSAKIIKELRKLVAVRDQIIKNHEAKNGHLCGKDLNALKDWVIDEGLVDANDEILHQEGKNELNNLGMRLRRNFEDLFKEQPVKNFFFRPTNTERSKSSLKAFALGVLGTDEVEVETPPKNDTLLLMHKNCKAWDDRYVQDHLTAEKDNFINGTEVINLVRNMNERLGFSSDTFTYKKMRSMYEMCRYETAWHANDSAYTSAWCRIFTPHDLKVLEFAEDLDYYYCCGPGREMSKRMGCRPLANMFENFKKLENGNFTGQARGAFLFAHSQTLQTFFSALSLGQDATPIRANNFNSSGNRSFRTSLTGTFATNFVAVFHRCEGMGDPYKVATYVDEQLVTLPGCRSGLCDWAELKKQYGKLVDGCTLDFCTEQTVSSSTETSGTSIDKPLGGGASQLKTRHLWIAALLYIVPSRYNLTG